MIEPLVVQQVIQRLDGACLGIHGPINNDWDPREHDGPSTHGAWFQRYVQRTFLKPPIPDRLGCLGNRDHLRVSRGIVKLLSLIVRRGNDATPLDNDGTHRDLTFFVCLLCLDESLLHEDVMWLVLLERCELMFVTYHAISRFSGDALACGLKSWSIQGTRPSHAKGGMKRASVNSRFDANAVRPTF